MSLLLRHRRLPLRAKLSLWVSIGVTAIVVAMMLAMLVALERSALHSVTQVQSALLEGMVRDIDGKVALRRDALRLGAPGLGERAALGRGPAIEAYFAAAPLLRSLFDTLVLADARGEVIYSSRGLPPPGAPNPPISDRPYFQEAVRTGVLVFTPPLIARMGAVPFVGMALPLHDATGRLSGVLVGLLNLDQANFVSAVSATRLGEGGYLTLMTRGAAPVYVAHPDARRVMQAVPLGGDPGFTDARHGHAHTFEADDETGEPALVTHRALASAPWLVEAVYPTWEAFAGLRHQQRLVVIAGSLVAAASAVLVWWLTRMLTAPLERLRQAMQQDATGSENLLQSMHADSTDVAALLEAYYAQKNRRVATGQLLDRTGAIAGVGGWSLEIATGVVSWTDQTRRLHEVDEGFVPTVETGIDFYAEEGRPAIVQAVQRATESGTPWDLVLPLRTAKGRSLWARATGEVEFEDGKPVRMFGVFQDVSQRVEHERQLREQAELLQTTLKSIGDGVITTDERGQVRWMNPAAERMTGWTSDAAAGHPTAEVFRIVHADTRAPAPDPVAICLATLEIAGLPARTVLLSLSGAETAIEDSASPIHDANGGLRGAVLVFHDVSEQRRMSDQMTYRATHDPLTGLVNRAEFELRLARALAKSGEPKVDNAMLFIDLDQFKLVNDACGHAMGDKLLCQVSELLRATVRNRDTLSRLGGDEFAVLLEHCTVAQAQRVAQAICDRMEEFRFVHDGRRFRIGASIGLAPVDARFADVAAVQHAADAACYAAKEAGRNRVHVWFDTDVLLRGRDGETQWGSRLEAALDDDDFVLYAQQIEPLQTPRAGLHFEILIRLREADGSIVAPGQFLPAAERYHMASRIDRWVLRRVFEWLVGEAGTYHDVATVSVNLSGQSIGDRAFHRYVAELLLELPIDATKLCFEVTETAAITNLADASAFIREMRGLGMRVALDDFGAGASSFGYLKNLPVDYLKIDGQFIRNIETDPLDMAAVRCFHEVARAIGVETIAEFVETEAVREVLRGIGVDHVQGYLVHRPEPLEELLRKARSAAAVARRPGASHATPAGAALPLLAKH